MKKVGLLALLWNITAPSTAQDSSGKNLSLSWYAELYYQYDFNKPANGNRPGFVYSHNRHHEFNLNLGFLKAAYSAERWRANLALAAGTYVNANYAAEPGVLKNVMEANAGIRLSRKKSLWLDMGIFPSHIGFESAASKDCWTLTRSMLADNSPYFEAGAKVSYTTDDGKWLLSGMALNGWQRITRLSGNSLLSWGAQLQYKASEKLLLNYSNFIGTDKPDSDRRIRVFHNIYGVVTFNEQPGITAGVDIGTEQNGNGGVYTWYSPVIILKYTFNHQWAVAGRAEYYRDKNGVIIVTNTANGFQTAGYSFNIDYAPVKNVLVRLEARTFRSKDAVFAKGNDFVRYNSFITASIAAGF